MTRIVVTAEERRSMRLTREPMLRLVASANIKIAAPFDEDAVLRCVAEILLVYGQMRGLGDLWRYYGIVWIPGFSRGRWLRRRWGYMRVAWHPTFMGESSMALSVVFDAVTGRLVRFRYHDPFEFRWQCERGDFGEIQGGLIQEPEDHPFRGESRKRELIERFVATIDKYQLLWQRARR
ncbi:MAG: hypothetical protein JNK05_31870 [Myxococcales bacterium]|nr:hypothetical protein [Myxococcales bacterium]